MLCDVGVHLWRVEQSDFRCCHLISGARFVFVYPSCDETFSLTFLIHEEQLLDVGLEKFVHADCLVFVVDKIISFPARVPIPRGCCALNPVVDSAASDSAKASVDYSFNSKNTVHVPYAS